MVDIASIIIKPGVLKLIPKSVALEYSVLPIALENDTIAIALPEQHDPNIADDLAFMLGKKLKIDTFPNELLTAALHKNYGVTEIEKRRTTALSANTEIFSVTQNEDTKFENSTGGSVVALVDRIISDAIRMGASDIHVEPYERSIRIRYRLDGILHEVLHPPPDRAKHLISRLKIMADLDIAEKRRPQDGRIRVRESDRSIDIRVSTLPTDFGEKIVLRILDKSQLQLDLSKLGFEADDLQRFQKTVRLPYGMILVTGPTGSGKTTTLYAALNYINQSDINITTIEDPIEYNLPGINQTHVRSEIGLTFAAALRSILRQDPNVIMVGEIRDGDTAEIAIRSALTGHLVLSTLHTNDATSAITRLVDMGVEPFLVASSLKMILAQRLLRRLCSQCKSRVEPTHAQCEELHLENRANGTFFKPTGCPACHQTGYHGRTAVYEQLHVHNGTINLITRNASSADLLAKARADGMLTLREAAIQKAARGDTSLDEVIRETAESTS